MTAINTHRKFIYRIVLHGSLMLAPIISAETSAQHSGHSVEQKGKETRAANIHEGQSNETDVHDAHVHERHVHENHEHPQADAEPREPIPSVTDADRAAAFPAVAGHAVHDKSIHYLALLDRLEAWDADPGTGLSWEAQAWAGSHVNRVWFRSAGERAGGTTEIAGLEVFYGKATARWWDVLVGIRHDFHPEAESQSFLALGVTGLAPYKFEVAATAYIGEGGQTAAELETEYEILLTNRLILQPVLEISLFGKDDESRGIGAGLSSVEAGMRLRYEIRREFAPYIGVSREKHFGKTADFRGDHYGDIEDTRVVAGLRTWF